MAFVNGIVTHVGGLGDADVLGVALRHVDDSRVDLDLLSPSLLPPTVALTANVDRDLVARPTVLGGAPEDVARHEEEGGVFVERFVCFAPKLAHGFAEGRERFGSNLRPQYVTAERRIGLVVRPVTGLVTRNELFDLAKRSAARNREPRTLVFRSRYARKLARGGPRYGASTQRFAKMRQAFERFGYTETLFGPSWAVAEESFDVLGEAAEAEMQMNIGAPREEKRAPSSLSRRARSLAIRES